MLRHCTATTLAEFVTACMLEANHWHQQHSQITDLGIVLSQALTQWGGVPMRAVHTPVLTCHILHAASFIRFHCAAGSP